MPEKLDLEKIAEAVADLEGKATAALETLEKADSPEAREAAEKDVKALQDQVATLEADKVEAEGKAQVAALKDDVKSLTDRFEAARKVPNFNIAAPTVDDGATDREYGPNGKRSFYADVKAAKSGRQDANERLDAVAKEFDEKAMSSQSDAAGGFLVPPEISDELLKLREAQSVLRGIIPSHPISTDELRIAATDNGLAVAWTAELTEKLQSEFKFSELSAGVFTAAGLALASNQLLKDSRFSVDQLINADLAKRFIALEEQAFINGSGEGQPLGIRNTPGVISLPLKTASPEAVKIVDRCVDAITEIYTNYFGAPNAILMHPRTWGFLVKARQEGTPNAYLLGPPSTVYGRQVQDSLPGYGQGPLPVGELFGTPVYTSPNVPTTLGGGTESCIIVGNFSEALILDREGIQTDQSEHVFFTSNQTVFRSEERLGFTAARYPKAFAVIEGTGLAGV